MRKFCTAALGLAAGAAVTFATTSADANGDIPPPFSWTGFYFGAHAGGGAADTDFIASTPIADPHEPISFSPGGFVGGAQIGYQKQWGAWLAGVELSYSAPDLRDTVISTAVADRTRCIDISNIFLAGVRLGYANGGSLLYVRGGYANAEVKITSHVINGA